MLADSVVSEAVRLTFEEMAFLDVAVGPCVPAGPPWEEGPVLYLEYTRPTRGALALFLPKEIKFEIAEAIYGEAWDRLSAAQLDDSLLEVLNVLAGRLLTKRFGAGNSYSMGLPAVLYDRPDDLPGSERRELAYHIDALEFSLVWSEVKA